MKRRFLAALAFIAFTVCLQGAPGEVDSSFNPGSGANDSIYSVVLQPDGKVLAGGSFTNFNGANRGYITRLNGNGSSDSTFTPSTWADFLIYSLALQTDGKVLLAGNGIVRLNANGSVDSTFFPGNWMDYSIHSIGLQSDGKVVLGGAFTVFEGVPRGHLVRLRADGFFDNSFDPGLGADADVYAVAVQTDDKLLAVGAFTSMDGTNRSRIARLNENGTLDASFNPGAGANTNIFCLALQPDGRILIGGEFTFFDGVARNGIARLNTNGTLDTAFDPGLGVNGQVRSIAVQPDGKVLIGGNFTTVNTVNRQGIARLNSNGSLDTTFNPAPGANDSVLSLALQKDGGVLLGGDFTMVNDVARARIARLQGDPVLLSIQKAGGNEMVLSWANPAFSLQGASAVGGTFTNVPGATSPYTNTIPHGQHFFRLQAD